MSIDRPHNLHVYLSADERRWLGEIATVRGTSLGDVVRYMLRDEHDKLVEQGYIHPVKRPRRRRPAKRKK